MIAICMWLRTENAQPAGGDWVWPENDLWAWHRQTLTDQGRGLQIFRFPARSAGGFLKIHTPSSAVCYK